jgi:hypothetical protein
MPWHFDQHHGVAGLCAAYNTKMRRDAYFTGITAVRLWDLPLPQHLPVSPIEVAVPLGTAPIRGRGVIGRHEPPGVRPVRLQGLRVLDPAATWASAARTLSVPDLVAIGDALVSPIGGRAALCSIDELRAELESRAGRPGTPRARRAIGFVQVGALSRPESLVRFLLLAGGVPPPELNVPLGAARAVIDLAWSEYRFGLEYDGEYHRSASQFAADIRRQELVHDHGWLLMRITKSDLFGDPRGVVRRVRRRLAARGAPAFGRDLSQSVAFRP